MARDPQQPMKNHVVVYRGRARSVLNPLMILRQGLDDAQCEKIVALHCRRYEIHDQIEATDDPRELRALADQLTRLEFELQAAWGFPMDETYHRFWETPKCTCPKMDNNDDYPHRAHINGACPLHGSRA